MARPCLLMAGQKKKRGGGLDYLVKHTDFKTTMLELIQ